MFNAEDRAAARGKLGWQQGQVDECRETIERSIAMQRSNLPEQLEDLRTLAREATGDEESIAINRSILKQSPQDIVAMNRLGRAYQAIGWIDQAKRTFQQVIGIDPSNQIARSE